MRKTNAAPLSTEPAHYEAALQELEKLVLELEGGQMPLDQLLAGYQRGAQLLAYCRDKLAAVEQQIKVLDGCLLYTSPSPRDRQKSRMPSSA